MAENKIKAVVTCRKQCFIRNSDGDNKLRHRGDKITLSEGELAILSSMGRAAEEGTQEANDVLDDVKTAPSPVKKS